MNRKKKDPKTIAKLTQWLAREGNTSVVLAAAMNYRSSMVVEQWINRGRIPEHQRRRVLDFIQSSGKEISRGIGN